jgi:hypothetical protein
MLFRFSLGSRLSATYSDLKLILKAWVLKTLEGHFRTEDQSIQRNPLTQKKMRMGIHPATGILTHDPCAQLVHDRTNLKTSWPL